MVSKRSSASVTPDTWLQNVYDVLSEVELWIKKPSYEDYRKKIDTYSKNFTQFPSQKDLLNPAEYTRGIFIATEEYIAYAGGFDYEYGYEDLFNTLHSLFKKVHIPFSWKRVNDLVYEYVADSSKYKWDVSSEEGEDGYEVSSEAFEEVDININKALKKRNLYLVHTPTGDQTTDYVLIKKGYIGKLRQIFPGTEGLQVFTHKEHPENWVKKADKEADEEWKLYKKSSYIEKLTFRWRYLKYIHSPFGKVIFLFFGEQETESTKKT